MVSIKNLFPLAVLALLATTAHAEWRCDCTKVTGSCSATVEVAGNWIDVASDSKECSRVDYFVEGQPFVTVVVDGEGKQNWLSRTNDPTVLVRSCQVCQDNLIRPTGNGRAAPAGPAAAEQGTPAQAAVSSAPATLIKVAPVYPDEAGGASGHVVVEFAVTPGGTVTNPRVVSARPSNVFNRAALDAVRRWRFQPIGKGDADPKMRTVTERLEFRPTSFTAGVPAAGSGGFDGTVENRNQCIKPGLVYDLIDMVETQLMNVCTDPVIVYSCTEGFGRSAGSWVCGIAAGEATVLVRRGDPRIGDSMLLDTGSGNVRATYAEEGYLARPPSTRYWWIACQIDDLDCHRAARNWQDYLHLKARSVDPRQVSQIAVAASN